MDESLESEDVDIESIYQPASYALRNVRRWSPVYYGYVPLYDINGGLGLLDPSTRHYYRMSRRGVETICAYDLIVVPGGPFRCGATLGNPSHGHLGVPLKFLLELRFWVVLRAYAVARRVVPELGDLNAYAYFTRERLFGNSDIFMPFTEVPPSLVECANTGFVFPTDRYLFSVDDRHHGMITGSMELSPALIKFTSHVESVHFHPLASAFTDRVSYDCSTVIGRSFPPWYATYSFDDGDSLRKYLTVCLLYLLVSNFLILCMCAWGFCRPRGYCFP